MRGFLRANSRPGLWSQQIVFATALDLFAENAQLKSNPNELELLKLRGEVTVASRAAADADDQNAEPWNQLRDIAVGCPAQCHRPISTRFLSWQICLPTKPINMSIWRSKCSSAGRAHEGAIRRHFVRGRRRAPARPGQPGQQDQRRELLGPMAGMSCSRSLTVCVVT